MRLIITVPIPRKLRHSSSYPALNATHPSRSVSNSTLVDSWPLSLAIPPLSPPTTIKETGAQDGAEASHHSRASSSGNLEIRHLSRPYRLSDVDRNRVAGAIQKLKCAVDNDWAEHLAKAIANAKVAKDEEWTVRLEQAVGQAKAAKDDERTKRLEEAVGHAKTAKDTEWTECLEKAVAQAEAIKDEELEAFARIKESNHENDMEDLKEDHEHQIQELEESHVEALQKLTTKHEEELLTLARKHAAEARKLELRRTQGVKELTRLKQELSEVEAEKMTMEKDLTHMTGQRDALHKAFVAMTGQHPSQVTTAPVDTPHIEQDLLQHPEEAEDTHETPDQESTPTTPTKANMFKRTAIPATTSTPLTPHPPHPPPQPTYHTIVPPSHYPRIQILETENAHLRTSLEQRHKDVTYANHKSDNLRALLEADPDKSSTYADILIHKETIHDLESRLQESWEAVEREKLESERLREKIDLLVEEVKKEEVGRNVAVKDRETAWMRNENLLRELKGVFKRSDFDIAFWTHYEALVKEKEGLEGDIEGYKRERHALMEEAIDTKAKMRQLELEHAVAASEAADEASEEGGVQDLKNQLLTRQIENEAMRAEISFLTAEVENRKVAPEMPQALKDVSQMVLDEKNRVIEELRSRLRGGGGGRKGYRGGGREEYGDGDVEDRGVEGRGGCGDTPRSDTSFF